MVTTPLPAGQQPDASDLMHQMFGGQTSIVDKPSTQIADPDTMRDDPRSRIAVMDACSMLSLADFYNRSTDADGNVQPGRFLSVMPRYTVLGGGTHSLKRVQDGNTTNELTGVIVRLAPYRVLYGRKVDDIRYAPSCASLNLVHGTGDPGQACQSCPKAAYINRDTPWCRHKSRMYLVLRESAELALVDLTAMSREGLDPFMNWCKQHRLDASSMLVKLKLSAHPRSPQTGNNQSSLVSVRPGAFVDRGSDDYRQALAQVNRVLATAEAAWLSDIGNQPTGAGAPASIGDSHLGQAPAVTAPEPRAALGGAPPMPAHQAMPAPPATDWPAPPADDDLPLDFDAGDEWSDVDDLPF